MIRQILAVCIAALAFPAMATPVAHLRFPPLQQLAAHAVHHFALCSATMRRIVVSRMRIMGVQWSEGVTAWYAWSVDNWRTKWMPAMPSTDRETRGGGTANTV